jgi:transcriptional regulator with XRE-family HTH domain
MLHLEFARRRKQWTQAQLGAVVRIHQNFVSELERGVATGTPDQRERLARALDVDPATLLRPVVEAITDAEAETPQRLRAGRG